MVSCLSRYLSPHCLCLPVPPSASISPPTTTSFPLQIQVCSGSPYFHYTVERLLAGGRDHIFLHSVVVLLSSPDCVEPHEEATPCLLPALPAPPRTAAHRHLHAHLPQLPFYCVPCAHPASFSHGGWCHFTCGGSCSLRLHRSHVRMVFTLLQSLFCTCIPFTVMVDFCGVQERCLRAAGRAGSATPASWNCSSHSLLAERVTLWVPAVGSHRSRARPCHDGVCYCWVVVMGGDGDRVAGADGSFLPLPYHPASLRCVGCCCYYIPLHTCLHYHPAHTHTHTTHTVGSTPGCGGGHT